MLNILFTWVVSKERSQSEREKQGGMFFVVVFLLFFPPSSGLSQASVLIWFLNGSRDVV